MAPSPNNHTSRGAGEKHGKPDARRCPRRLTFLTRGLDFLRFTQQVGRASTPSFPHPASFLGTRTGGRAAADSSRARGYRPANLHPRTTPHVSSPKKEVEDAGCGRLRSHGPRRRPNLISSAGMHINATSLRLVRLPISRGRPPNVPGVARTTSVRARVQALAERLLAKSLT